MKLKFLFFAALYCLLGFATQAQSEKSLVGYWVYQDIPDKSKMDSLSLVMLDKLFGSLSFSFEQEHKYHAFLMGTNDKGSWNLTDDKQYILLDSDKSADFKLSIIKLEKKLLTIDLDGQQFVLRREKKKKKVDKK